MTQYILLSNLIKSIFSLNSIWITYKSETYLLHFHTTKQRNVYYFCYYRTPSLTIMAMPLLLLLLIIYISGIRRTPCMHTHETVIIWWFYPFTNASSRYPGPGARLKDSRIHTLARAKNYQKGTRFASYANTHVYIFNNNLRQYKIYPLFIEYFIYICS